MAEKKLKAVDFFCGAGGMSFGLKKAGIDVIAGIDFNKDCRETYELNTKAKFIEEDVELLKPSSLSSLINIKQNDDSLIFAGCSPCQYWTLIATNKSKASKSKNLLMKFQDFVEYFRPGYVVIENVPGLLNNPESPLHKFLDFLSENDYSYSYKILNLSLFGVPQNRKRFFLIASRLHKSIELPDPGNIRIKTVKDVIGAVNGFPKIKHGHRDESSFMHTCASLESINLKRLRRTPKDGGNRLSWSRDPELQLKAYINKDNCFKDVYGRAFWNKPSPTITTKFYSISNGRFAHPDENRAFSLREGATLQTFPKNYKFCTKNIIKAATLIGNAVPPLFAKHVGKHIISLQIAK
ncbi:MAG: DNA cytosine methyltransferase [Candidatus Caenarcaniphilales bacterium]|nr:DNA cytosine methyltransferase [Candidatus Caenarcaniphilales bacterium]